MSRLPLALLALALSAACGGGAPPLPAKPAKPPHVVDEWTARQDIRWPAHTGRLTVTAVLSSDKTVVVKDAGTLVREAEAPAGGAASTWWRYRWTGVWSGDGRARALRLAPAELTCETTTGGQAATCPDQPAALGLACDRERLTVGELVPAGTPPEQIAPPTDQFAWVCRLTEGGSEHTGTQAPWVFGIDVGIRTVIAGDPAPATSYVREAGAEEW